MSDNTLNRQDARLGFLGLGLMGSRLVRRLHSSGWSVQGWNRSAGPTKLLSQAGIDIADSVARLTADSEVILSSLGNDEAVHSVYFDEGGVFSAVKPGTITLLAGGDQDTFDRCIPIYESIAKQWFLIGPATSGILMKLVVNLLLGVNMQAIAEAASLGEHLRLKRDVLLDVLSRTTVVPPALLGKFQKIKSNDYSPQFPLRLMSKDMDLVNEAATASGAELPATKVAQSILASLVSSSGNLDMSAITPFVGHFLDPK